MLRVAITLSAASLLSVVVVGCSGGVAPAADTGAESTSVEQEQLSVAGITKVLLSDGVCGSAPGYCRGHDSVEVDLISGTLVRTACVEQGDDPSSHDRLPTKTTSTSRTLTAEDLRRVREALGAVRFTNEISTARDGYMAALTVTSTSGVMQRYSPLATCGQSAFKTVVAGFEAVTTVFYGL